MSINVTSLKYFGGQDEDLGGYLEALRVEKPDEFLFPIYVLHEMRQERDMIWDFETHMSVHGPRGIINNHRAVFYLTEAELMKAHGLAWSLLERIDRKIPWQEADSVCGFNLSPEEFYDKYRQAS